MLRLPLVLQVGVLGEVVEVGHGVIPRQSRLFLEQEFSDKARYGHSRHLVQVSRENLLRKQRNFSIDVEAEKYLELEFFFR